MLSKIYAHPICSKYYIQHSVVPEPGKKSGFVPVAALSPVEDFVNSVVPASVAKTQHAPVRAYYRPALCTKDGEAVGTTVIWADVDTRLDDPVQFNTKLEELQVSPSYVVWSGGGYHIYWLLEEPCFDQPRINAILSKISDLLGGDEQQAKITGGLRMVGSKNWKWDGAPEVAIVTSNTGEDGEPLRHRVEHVPYDIEEMARPAVKVGNAEAATKIFLKYFPTENPNAKSWMVECPCHSDSSPSLSINLEKGVWYCHSKKHEEPRGGSAVSFYAMMEGVPYSEALEKTGVKKGDDGLVAHEILKEELLRLVEPLYRNQEETTLTFSNVETLRIGTVKVTKQKHDVDLACVLEGNPYWILREAMPAELDSLSDKKFKPLL
jgi:hypothetical protein